MKSYVRNIKILKPGRIDGKNTYVGEIINPRNFGWGDKVIEFLEENGIAEIRRYTRK